LEKEKVAYQGRVRTYSLLAGVGILFIIGLLLFRNNRQKRRSNERLKQALDHLKTTQSQLVHSEKMASLGELTAGIAHEIQNPLNFVNNFSEINRELLDELRQAIQDGKMDAVIDISNNIRENEEKIMHHGNRADSIVKGMLQHARSSTGTKEPADINALVEEYTRLAYHGIRARDKAFKGEYAADLDPAAGTINVVPQDMGRVVLNLVNNAFHAASAEALAKGDSDFKPLVRVSTRRVKDTVEIKVEDNGAGIPAPVKEKIFQPFFTTKPTGQGTGLGLSLSYDIVTKGHGGTLVVEKTGPDGTSFVISLPANHT
jgi:signal transduction histidine kinase